MYDLIYSLIIFFATFLGAFVGLGGGVIIKPLLDLIGHDSIATVNFISAFAVFSMSISSTIKHIKAKTKIDFKFIITLSIGSVAGGIAGSRLFDYMLTIFDNTDLKRIQGIILGILLIISVIYINLKKRKAVFELGIVAHVRKPSVRGTEARGLQVAGQPVKLSRSYPHVESSGSAHL